MMVVLVTGGAGFIGSHLAIRLKRDRADARVLALDNLKRRGSELNIDRLRQHGVEFLHGDIRCREDLGAAGRVDCLIECSAEPSVQAGYDGAPEYIVNTNLVGTLNCLELARRHGAGVIFLSTSRVYPIRPLNALAVVETDTRYELADAQHAAGASAAGISEAFGLDGARTLYGATKLASELLLTEYIELYGLRGVVNRCGVVAGAWQMGRIDQGVVAHWVARHVYGGVLRYIGYGGTGKQVRDVLHIDDLYRLVDVQLGQLDALSGEVFNAGGGREVSVSLRELTTLCEEATGRRLSIGSVPETHPSDVRVYLSDCGKIRDRTGWTPRIPTAAIVEEVARWMQDHRDRLAPIFA